MVGCIVFFKDSKADEHYYGRSHIVQYPRLTHPAGDINYAVYYWLECLVSQIT